MRVRLCCGSAHTGRAARRADTLTAVRDLKFLATIGMGFLRRTYGLDQLQLLYALGGGGGAAADNAAGRTPDGRACQQDRAWTTRTHAHGADREKGGSRDGRA